MNKFLKWIKSPASDFALFVVILLLANIASQKAFLRLDLTGQRSYSLSQASKDTVKNLTQPLSVKVFFSDNLPSPYNGTAQYVKDILVEYNGAANKNFSYQFFNMKKAESQKTARDYGIRQVSVRQIKNSEVAEKLVYMGIAVTYGDAIEVIDQITDDSGFEYNLTTKIAKMISQQDTLAGLSENDQITLTFYFSEALKKVGIAGIKDVEESVKTAFNSANTKNQNRLSFIEKNPPQADIEELSEKYGLQSFNLEEKDGTKTLALFGLVLEYKENFRQVPLSIQRSIFGYGIAGLDSLEENISGSLETLLSKSTEIGYITGHDEAELTDENGNDSNFRKLLQDMYNLRTVKLSEEDIPSNLTTIIINGPKLKFGQEELYKIDQFIMKGGNVMIFADPFTQSQANPYQPATYTPLDTGLNSILEKYGIKPESNYVLDEGCYTYNQAPYGNIKMYWVPMLLKQSLSQKSVITKNLAYLIFLQPGEINTTEASANKNLKVTNLAQSSARSWVLSENIQISPEMQPPYNKNEFKKSTIAAIVEGKFTSAFEKNPTQEDSDGELKEKSHIAQGTQVGKIFVAGTSYITSNNQINESGSEPIAIFVRNAVDYMNGNTDLCTMRTKGLSLNTLQNTNTVLAVILRYFNQFGLTILVAIIGLFVWRFRIIRKKQIHNTYNPNDSREITR